MARIVCFANQKGGVGKTTTCVNLCAAVKEKRRKVLLVDADPQGNATSAMGVDKNRQKVGTYDVLIGRAQPGAARVRTKFGDLLPSNKALSGALIELVDMPEREYILRKALEPIKNEYDYIIIDCPPSLELLTLNGLVAADLEMMTVSVTSSSGSTARKMASIPAGSVLSRK